MIYFPRFINSNRALKTTIAILYRTIHCFRYTTSHPLTLSTLNKEHFGLACLAVPAYYRSINSHATLHKIARYNPANKRYIYNCQCWAMLKLKDRRCINGIVPTNVLCLLGIVYVYYIWHFNLLSP